ncbi:MAG: hypothetical protein WB803_18485, partial [Pseudolabrys sp.]
RDNFASPISPVSAEAKGREQTIAQWRGATTTVGTDLTMQATKHRNGRFRAERLRINATYRYASIDFGPLHPMFRAG